jgi:hypothetical protein
MPITGGAHVPNVEGETWKRRSCWSMRGDTRPARNSPMRMITTPAIWLRPRWWRMRAAASALAVAPRATNTTVKPATNSSVERRIVRWSARVCTASWLAPTPDIIDR